MRLDAVPPYLMWMFVTPKDADSDAKESPQTPESLHAFVRERLHDWHPDLRRLVELADIPSIFPISIRSSRPVSPWTTSRVTLLGDVIHAMTPAGGIGANTAMRDAALLSKTLAGVDGGEMDLLEAVAAYEAAMRDYGFAAVERSLYVASQLYRITIPAGEGFS